MIYILSGPTRSGKTSKLSNHYSTNPRIGGFLSPDGPNGRLIKFLPSGQVIPFESNDTHGDVINVGRFAFNRSAFTSGNRHVLSQLSDPGIDLILIDEIGHLELRGSGFASIVRPCIAQVNKDKLFVIRESLLTAVIGSFAIDDFEILSTNSITDWPYKFNGV